MNADSSTTIEGSDCCTYDALAFELAGNAGSWLIQAVTFIESFGAMVCFVVFHAANWPVVLELQPTTDALLGIDLDSGKVCTVIVCAVALPTLLLQPSHLASLSAVGLFASITLIIVSMAAPMLDPHPLVEGNLCPSLGSAAELDPAATGRMQHDVAVPAGLGAAIGLTLFCFSGHATFPELCTLRDARPQSFEFRTS